MAISVFLTTSVIFIILANIIAEIRSEGYAKYTLIALLFSIALTALSWNGVGRTYSIGTRVGTVNKVSHKGILRKSWEVNLVQQGLSDKGNQNMTSFNVPQGKDELLSQLLLSAEEGAKVRLTYNQWFIRPVWIDNNRVIQKVELLK